RVDGARAGVLRRLRRPRLREDGRAHSDEGRPGREGLEEHEVGQGRQELEVVEEQRGHGQGRRRVGRQGRRRPVQAGQGLWRREPRPPKRERVQEAAEVGGRHGGAAAGARELAARATPLLPGVVAAAAAGGLAAGSGGDFPPAWGWAAVALAWVAGLALLLPRSIRLAPPEPGLIGALRLLAAWTGLSTVWSTDLPQSVLETQRTLVYVTGVAAILLLVRRRDLATVPAGLLVGIVLVCGYAFATRLFPDRFGGF